MMTVPTRRSLLLQAGALGLMGGLPRMATAQGKPKLVVIGGGPGGATVAKYVARDSNAAIDVTLVTPERQFTTCFHSNLFVGGLRSWESITHGYDALAAKFGVRLVHQRAEAIDRDRKVVRLADGAELPYDRLAVAPGIDLRYDSVPGYSEAASEAMPHAWIAGPQTQLLKRQLDALPDGALIVMVTPPNPYRCPPGPYERASMMAHVLKAKGHSKSRIIILDPKETFSKQALFQEGWENHYPGMIEWQDPNMHGGIKGVDPKAMTVKTDLATYRADLVNVIPAQMAGRIAREAGLADRTGYCPIDPTSMRSAQDPNIYVIGDACISGDMPKSAFAANSQAHVAAMMIRAELSAAGTSSAHYANTCWSMITADDAVKVGGRYEPKNGRIAAAETFISQTSESAELRAQTQAENMDWYAAFTADVFS
jgi:NADPH-dependent 2,4-dienoyl-CoA reductase/sulfur reductase-like enzyme